MANKIILQWYWWWNCVLCGPVTSELIPDPPNQVSMRVDKCVDWIGASLEDIITVHNATESVNSADTLFHGCTSNINNTDNVNLYNKWTQSAPPPPHISYTVYALYCTFKCTPPVILSVCINLCIQAWINKISTIVQWHEKVNWYVLESAQG